MEVTELWNEILKAAIALPMVKVNRVEFIQKELTPYCTPEQILLAVNDSPTRVLTKSQLNKIANGCINWHTTLVCSTSVLSGLPGGWALAATVPIDMAQFYGHVFALIQKLLYLHGWADLLDEKGKLNDEMANTLTLFVGVMLGSYEATQIINAITKALAKQTVKRLPKVALTKLGFYNVAKQVAKWIGVKLTKDSFAKNIGKVIPLIGAPISATLTYWTFKPMATKLKKQLDSSLDISTNTNKY